MSEKTVQYTLDDCGCYVDGARGWYGVRKIVDFANLHGAAIEYKTNQADCNYDFDCEDEADDFMNDHFPVPGATWGRSEQGDWGLWANGDE